MASRHRARTDEPSYFALAADLVDPSIIGAMNQDELKALVGRAALAYVVPGQLVGVGTGSTVNHFIDALASIKHQIKGAVSSSEASTLRLRAHGIAVLDASASPACRFMSTGLTRLTTPVS